LFAKTLKPETGCFCASQPSTRRWRARNRLIPTPQTLNRKTKSNVLLHTFVRNESRRCSRDTYPESYITEYTLVYEEKSSTLNGMLSRIATLYQEVAREKEATPYTPHPTTRWSTTLSSKVTQPTLGPYVVHIWSRNTPDAVARRDPLSGGGARETGYSPHPKANPHTPSFQNRLIPTPQKEPPHPTRNSHIPRGIPQPQKEQNMLIPTPQKES